jgi:hypothetical protein
VTISVLENALNETKCYRRRRAVKLSAIGEGAERKYALSPTAPKEINYALPYCSYYWAKFKKLPDTFYPNKKGLFRPKNHLTLLSL